MPWSGDPGSPDVPVGNDAGNADDAEVEKDAVLCSSEGEIEGEIEARDITFGVIWASLVMIPGGL